MVQEDEIQEIVRTRKEEPRPLIQKAFVLILCAVAAIPAAIVLVHSAYERFFEASPPTIKLIEVPDGLGNSPATLKFAIEDSGAGLNDFVVRLKQRIGNAKILSSRELNGAPYIEETLLLGGEGSGLDPGGATITIKAFDRSIWSSSAEKVLEFKVDYWKPKVHVVSAQHNARIGGSQLVIYRAQGEDLAASGVQVGDQFFYGFPAKGIDPAMNEPDLHVVLYALNIKSVTKETQVRLFSQDAVKNISYGSFYNRVLGRRIRPVTVNTPNLEPQLLALDDFAALSQPEVKVAKWALPFMPPKGAITYSFGDQRVFKRNGTDIGKELVTGYEFRFNPAQPDVVAANDGKVLFIAPSKKRGTILSIDHGFGLVSVYDRLTDVPLKVGDHVKREQLIGKASLGEGSTNPDMYYEIRLHTVPVDAREWWEQKWCQEHIIKKLESTKKLIAVAKVE